MKIFAFAAAMVLIGAGGGFLGGYVSTVFDGIRTDTQVSCALLQVAENAGYVSREQRGELVDEVVPRPTAPRPGADWIRRYADSWWDGVREDQKSGCPDV